MSPRLRQVRSRDAARVLQKLGFVKDRQSGSHAVYRRSSDMRRVTVPMHGAITIKPKTLYGIIKDMGLTPSEFKELL
jgi:predicted RNA binding protein YcfA (HicA-like mRNA interferase family)